MSYKVAKNRKPKSKSESFTEIGYESEENKQTLKRKRPIIPKPVEVIDDEKEEIEDESEQVAKNKEKLAPVPSPPPKFEDQHVRKMIYLTHENQERLEKEKAATRQSVSRLVNEALDEYFT